MTAGVVALLFGVLAVWLSSREKGKAFSIIPAIIASVALFIAFPNSLHPDFIVEIGQTGNFIFALIGLLVIALSFAWEKFPSVLLLLGVLIVMWAGCRLLPTLPPAFDHLAPKLSQAGGEIWDAVVTFFKEASA